MVVELELMVVVEVVVEVVAVVTVVEVVAVAILFFGHQYISLYKNVTLHGKTYTNNLPLNGLKR